MPPRVPDYQPVGEIPVAATVAPIATNAGAAALADFAERLQRYASGRLQSEARQAEEEGAAAGRLAGDAGTFRPLPEDTIRARAYNKAALDSYARRLEINTRARLDELAAEIPDDPVQFKARAEKYRDGVVATLPPEAQASFNQAFDVLFRPYFNQVRRANEAAVADGARGTYLLAEASRISSIQRLARASIVDPDAKRALDAELSAAQLDLIQNGPKGAFRLGVDAEGKPIEYPADPTRSGAFTATQIAERLQRLHDEAVENTVMGAWEAGPKTPAWIEAFEKRELGPKGSGLREEQVQRLVATMRADWARRETERRAREQEARIKLGTRMEDELASLERTGKGIGVSDAEVAAAGHDLAKWQRQKHDAIETYTIGERLRLASPQELEALRAETRPEGEGFAAEARRRDLFEAAVEKRRKALAEDPAAYVAAALPELQQAFLDGIRDPAKLGHAVKLSLELQARVGLPQDAQAPLPKAVATAIVDQVTNEERPAAERFDLLARVVAGAGAYREAVLAQLEERKLPPEARLALDMAADPAQLDAARRVFGQLLTGAKGPALDAELAKQADQKALEAYAPRLAVRQLQERVLGDGRAVARASAEAKALQHVTRVRATGAGAVGGWFSGDPAAEAFADLFGNEAYIAEEGFAAVTFPAAIEKTEPGVFADGLAQLRAELAGRIFGDLPPLAKAQLERTLATGTWVNARGGYVLILPGTTKPVAGADGRPLVVTTEEVLAAGRAARETQRQAGAARAGEQRETLERGAVLRPEAKALVRRALEALDFTEGKDFRTRFREAIGGDPNAPWKALRAWLGSQADLSDEEAKALFEELERQDLERRTQGAR